MSRADGGLTTKALQYLASCKDIWAERCNSGKVPTKGGWVELGEPGTPDIRGYIKRAGRFALPFGIETKTPATELNDNQIKWHARASDFGFPVFTCRTLSEVIQAIQELRMM